MKIKQKKKAEFRGVPLILENYPEFKEYLWIFTMLQKY